jgi:ABC-2 type transport system ATP-binding protein
MGRKQLILYLSEPLAALPAELGVNGLELSAGGTELHFDYDTHADRTGITTLLANLNRAGLSVRDLETRQSSLEEIFVDLVGSQS